MTSQQERVLDHYKNPRNTEELKSPTNEGESKNLSCGDEVYVRLKIKNGRLEDVQMTAEGCSICVGSASILSEKLIGKTINELKAITSEGILNDLDIELNETRKKCAILSLSALQNAISKIE